MRLRAPNAFVLIVIIMTVMMVLTWIIPGGEYARESRTFAGTGTREIVLPDQFTAVDSNPRSPIDLLLAPMHGAERAAHTIAFVLLIGGAFGVLMATGVLMAGLQWLTLKVGGIGRFAVIPILMFTFSLGGALFGMAEECLVFVLLTIPLAISLRFDCMTGIAIPFVASQIGFATAFVNPFSFGIAKQIAEQPVDIGFGYRVFAWILLTGVGCGVVMLHAWRVGRDPTASPTQTADASWRERLKSDSTVNTPEGLLSTSQIITLAVLGLMIVLLAYGSIQLGWYINELAALFLAMALFCGLTARLTPNRMADAFMAGARDLCPTAIIIAFSRAIVVLAEDAHVIDTVLHAVAVRLDDFGPSVGVLLMYGFQSCLNFLIPSGSGQAALTMPIMTPLADILGISRENAILAFQFGDGFTNLIIPTSAILMGILSAAGVSYGAWLRWFGKWQLLLLGLGAVLLVVAPF